MGIESSLLVALKYWVIIYFWKYVFNKIIEYVFNKILYMPNAPSVEYRLPENNCPGSRSPEEYGYNYENIEVVTRDNIKLAGWFIYHEKPKEHPTIIFFHGNAGNIGTRLPNVQLMFEENKANIVIVGYRGYGHSQGSPSENGLQFDAEAVLDWTLRWKKISNSNIFVFGRSMGGAVAIHLASKYQHRLWGIIIENTFTSISMNLLFY